MRQDFHGILVAFTAGVAVLAVELVEILGSLAIEPPESVAYRTSFNHDPMLQHGSW